jgi:hypothetical protein
MATLWLLEALDTFGFRPELGENAGEKPPA